MKYCKKNALKNIPREIQELIIDTSKAKDKRSSTEILMELRYGKQ